MANPLRFFRRRRSQPKGRATRQSAFFSPVGGQMTGAGEPFFAPETAFVQPKLTVNKPGDAQEQEADKMANHVVQRATMKPDEEKVQRRGKPDDDHIQKKDAKEEEKPIQKKAGPGTSAAPVSAAQLHSTKGQGSPLSTPVQREMGQAFGHDFSPVRIHTSSQAEQLSQGLQALAFTHGKDVYFNAGQYNPQTTEGRRLLAHELTHVVQQNGTTLANVQRKTLTAAEKAEDLQSPRLRDDKRLQTAFDNDPPMVRGERSRTNGVKNLQRTLRELGYTLDTSFAKTGDADGIFGQETIAALIQFQTDNKLEKKDGIAGRETLSTLDQWFSTPIASCSIRYLGSTMNEQERQQFLIKHFEGNERPQATQILNDLCAVQQSKLSFETDQELRDDIFKRMRMVQYMQESQTDRAFAYPASASNKKCPGKTDGSIRDAQVNKDAKEYWEGPILGREYYYFSLTSIGRADAYKAIELLFTNQKSICDVTLIHCDLLITLVQIRAYADSIGKEVFNERVRRGSLRVYLNYDGMAVEGDKAPTPGSISLYWTTPSNENDLVIGDHVVFWNHLAYDAISTSKPGAWRLENALLVAKSANGQDLYEGHGAPVISRHIQPAPKEAILTELATQYNAYARHALTITQQIDNGNSEAEAELLSEYPYVKKRDNQWVIYELKQNSERGIEFYPLREVTGPNDPELPGLRKPPKLDKLNDVHRPVESK